MGGLACGQARDKLSPGWGERGRPGKLVACLSGGGRLEAGGSVAVSESVAVGEEEVVLGAGPLALSAPATQGGQAIVARRRGPADRVARRVLFLPDREGGEVYNLFSSSILLSATRCLLSYIVFPVLAPWLSEVPVVGPAIGVPVALAALVFDVRAVRRFFMAEHRWRWAAAGLYAVVIAMVTYLLVRDIAHLT